MDSSEIKAIKTTYPSIIAKDQLYRICHISKKTASFLLESGLIPNENTGKKTRKYRIRLDDVIQYLQDRETNGIAYKPPEGYYKEKAYPKSVKKRKVVVIPPEKKEEVRTYYEGKLSTYKDIMTTNDVSAVTGYSRETIIEWHNKNEIKCFLIHRKLMFPKEYVIDFMLSKRFNEIKKMSKKHMELLEEVKSIIK